jgi:PAS domain S-box-containing protein
VLSDITERKQAEATLRDSKAQLAQQAVELHRITHLMEPVACFVRDLQDRIVFWNSGAADLYGFSKDEALGQTAYTLLKTQFPAPLADILMQVQTAGTWDGELLHTHRDGQRLSVASHWALHKDPQGRPTAMLEVNLDISERKRAQAALRESEKRLRAAERLAHLGHWQWNLKSNELIWSEECSRIFGHPGDYRPSHQDFLRAVVPEDRELVERGARQRLAEKHGSSIEFRIVRPNGDVRVVRSISEPLLDEEGQPAFLFGACQDITDARREQEKSVARQKLESVGTLANGIAHDFNNLLGGILAEAELGLVELGAGLSPEAELKVIRDAALRGSEIVRELMIYAGKESPAVGLVDISEIVEEMLELLKVSVSKHAMLKTDLGKDLPAIRANAAQLRQIVMNLVTNASDAIGYQDGMIRVTTKCVKIGQDSEAISDRLAGGHHVQLEVSDTGHGMSLEMQAKVFDPFFTTKPQGHGLGLAIIDGIVRGLAGSIYLTSEPGRGTTFQILLPCAEAVPGTVTDPVSSAGEPAHPSPTITLLVVEDEDLLRQALVKMLHKAGFVALEAANGSAAIDILRTNEGKIDVILLDMTIPGASSHQVVTEAAQARPATRVILTSAYSQERLTPPLSASQVCGFIRKPFQLNDLIQMLRNVLGAAGEVS